MSVGFFQRFGQLIVVGAENGVVPYTHGIKSIQHFVAAFGKVFSVVGQVDHLYPVFQLTGIEGQQSRKEQLFIVAVGGEKQQIGLSVCRKLPFLNIIRYLSGSKDADLIEPYISAVKGKGHRGGSGTENGDKIHEIVEKSVFTQNCGNTGVIVGYGIAAVFMVKDQVKRTDSLMVFQGDPGMVCKDCGHNKNAVKQSAMGMKTRLLRNPGGAADVHSFLGTASRDSDDGNTQEKTYYNGK
jgi:hypothetical protein